MHDFEGGDVVLPSSGHYRGYAAVYDLTGDLVQAADFDLSDGGFYASAMGSAGGQDWLAGSFETGSNAPANEMAARDALSMVQHRLVGSGAQTFGGPDSDDISYLGEEEKAGSSTAHSAVGGGFVTGLINQRQSFIYAIWAPCVVTVWRVLVTWEDGTEGAVLPWTASFPLTSMKVSHSTWSQILRRHHPGFSCPRMSVQILRRFQSNFNACYFECLPPH